VTILTESNNYIVSYEYETVFLKFKDKDKEIVIGDFYGDPQTAFISNDESYCVIGGCGLIVYYLQEPFNKFQYNKKTKQLVEIFREPENIWWISNVEKGSCTECINFIIDPIDDEDKAGTYELNINTLQVNKLN
jgi:hypothetical protein